MIFVVRLPLFFVEEFVQSVKFLFIQSFITMSRVYFDIAIDGSPAGRIEFKLYDDVVPKTADNFRFSINHDN